MGGRSGIRGYLIQSIIAVLDSLNDPNWKSIIVEPNIGNDKVDICWISEISKKVSQVKSSKNQITLGMAKNWAEELETNVTSDEYELILIGPANKEITGKVKIGKVDIPIPQILNYKALINQASTILDRYLETFSITKLPTYAREIIIESLITKYTGFSTEGKEVKRDEFLSYLRDSILLILPEGINKATEELRLKYESISRVEEYKFKLKYEACLEALEVVDEYYLTAMAKQIRELFREHELEILNPIELGKKARKCHNRLVVSCDNQELILLFRRCLNIENQPETMGLIVDFRGAIRRELGFGTEVIDLNKDLAWIGTLGAE